MELEKYIFPIYSGGTIVGQGFVADGYFITAAHVAKDFPSCFTQINGKKFELSDAFIRSSFFNKSDDNKIIKENFWNNPFSKLKYIYIGIGNTYHDPSMMDIVMYPCNDIESPLHLSEHIPLKGEPLLSSCMYEGMDFSLLNPPCKLKTVPAMALGKEEGNYFYCDCKQYEGSSGSPLLKGNEVVGIMHGGNEKGLCAFLKVQVVRNIISQMELSLDFDSSDLDNAIEYNDCKYSRDKKRLLKGDGDTILQGTIVICNEAYCREVFQGDPYGLASGNIIIPNSVKKIGEKAFAWSDELESIEIPDSVVQIGKETFECCHFLKKVVLSNSITEIPEAMFSYCQSLSEITIPNSVTKIGEEAFENCNSLTNLIIPSSVKCIESLAFWECNSLKRVIFLGLVSKIEDNVFDKCDALSEIIIPAGTFDHYKELLSDYADLLIEDEYIKDGNTYLDWTPVGDAYTLEEICDAGVLGFAYNDIDGEDAEITVIEFSDGSISLRISVPLKNGKTIELKAAKNIQNGFDDGDNIKVNLIYGQELHKIGQESIVRYDVWESEEQKIIYLRERDGENLSTEVTEEDLANAWTDEYGVKYSKDKKRLLKVPKELKEYHVRMGTVIICDDAFSNITIEYEEVKSHCEAPDYIQQFPIFESEIEKVELPIGVISIGKGSFRECKKLKTILLGKGIKDIGDYAFSGCNNLSSISLPDTVVVIGKGAFNESGLHSVIIPNNVEEIGSWAFAGCHALSSVCFPNNIKKVGRDLFQGCFNLSAIYIPYGEKETFSSLLPKYIDKLVEIEDSKNLSTEVTNGDLANAWVDEFGVKYSADRKRLLKAANNLEDYSIKSGTIVICDDAFSQCKELQSVQIPDSVTTIGDFAFYNCGRLSSALLPKSVTNVGMSIFEGCERMPNYHPFE